MGYSIF